MLSAFTARPLVELKQRDKSKIESVVTHGDRLLVGLSNGHLRVYRINEPTDEPAEQDDNIAGDGIPASQVKPKPVDLMREQEKFSKYKIEQLAVLKEANVLLALSNGYIHCYDLQSYELRVTLAKTKGATAFAVSSDIVKDATTSTSSIVTRLAVAVKRRLILCTWRDGELETDTPELTLVTGIKTLVWASETRLFAGLTSSYVLVDIQNPTITDIVGPGSIGGAPGQDGGRFGGAGVASMGYLGMSAPRPLATKLGEGEMLLAKDINTLFIDLDANSLGRRQIPWSIAPEAVGYSHPYLIGLQATKGTLEVRNPVTLTLLQTIPLVGASQIYISPSDVDFTSTEGMFLVLGERRIWRMKALDYEPQINALVERGRLDEAISLVDMLDKAVLKNKKGRMRDIKMIKAQLLFDNHRYRDSIDLFTEVSAPPGKVISLYPPFIAGNASQNFLEADPAQLDGSSDSKRESSGDDTREPEDGTSAKILVKASTGDSASPQREHGPLLDGKDLKLATEELRGFLASARVKMKDVLNTDGGLKPEGERRVSNSEIGSLLGKDSFDASADQELLLETARLVDTTLFRAYMSVSPSFAGPLFRIDNFCDPDVVKEKLIEAGRYYDLVDFLYGKKLHRQALELLKKFGDTDKEDEAAPQLVGPRRTVSYLQSLPPEMIDLILQYADWPLRKDPELGMEVFMADTENAETLPRAAVLDFLEGIDTMLAVRYLEHMIDELNDTTPAFNQRLVDIYIHGLKSNDFPSDAERLRWKEKSLDFMRTSKNYQAYKALGQLSKDDPNLYEARAIVLSNMGQHKQALDIYVFKLQDADKAEEYCNQIFLTENGTASASQSGQSSITDRTDGAPSIYHTLLALYLSPPAPYQPQWGPALNVLAKHGARMPASSTLNLIPEILPIKELESYFRGRIRSANTMVNEGRVVAGLRSTLLSSEEAKLRLGDGVRGGNGGRNRRVVITEDRVCGVCHKRFGGSAIKVLPDNSVVHYGCSAR